MQDSTPIDVDRVLRDHPLIHGDQLYSLDAVAAKAVQRRLSPLMTTIETGCGLSTIIFASASTHHTTITPSRAEADAVLAYCSENRLPVDNLQFIIQPSHVALPSLESATADLVLVDGCHGIPMVQVDYLYASLVLKTGGCLVLDDIQIAPVQDLVSFLKTESAWRLDEVCGKTAFFTKLRAGEEIREWNEQPYVVANSRFKSRLDGVRRLGRGGKLLLSGDVSTFWNKLIGTSRP